MALVWAGGSKEEGIPCNHPGISKNSWLSCCLEKSEAKSYCFQHKRKGQALLKGWRNFLLSQSLAAPRQCRGVPPSLLRGQLSGREGTSTFRFVPGDMAERGVSLRLLDPPQQFTGTSSQAQSQDQRTILAVRLCPPPNPPAMCTTTACLWAGSRGPSGIKRLVAFPSL